MKNTAAAWVSRITAAAAALLFSPALLRAQSVQPVPALDLTRFTGTWYEIARLPNKAEKMCVGDALALYGLEDKQNHFSVVDSCSLKDGTPHIVNSSGKRPKGASDGRLEIGYLLLLHHRRWVLAVDPAYGWALVGSPNHKELWLLSRSVTLDPAVLADLKSRASAQGFNVAKLVTTPQSDRPHPQSAVQPAGAGAGGVAP